VLNFTVAGVAPVGSQSTSLSQEIPVRIDRSKSAKRLFDHYVYKSPLQMAVADMEDELSMKEIELESARENLSDLKTRYFSASKSMSGVQCGRCHLKVGHSKRKCLNESCISAESCCDLDKHPDEKKVFAAAHDSCKDRERELKKLLKDLENKKQAMESVHQTFSNQVFSHVVNSNTDKYTFATSEGRFVRRALVNQDICILEEHYNKKVPVNLELEASKFQNIINRANHKFGIERKHAKNPIRSMLENNTQYPVTFPLSQNKDMDVSCTPTLPQNSPGFGVPVPNDAMEEQQQLQAALRSSMPTSTWPPMQGFYVLPPYGNIGTPHGQLPRNTVPVVHRPPVCTVTSGEGSDDREHVEQSGVTLESQTRSANNTRLVLPPKKRPYNH
jgi:hypothetical protein